MEGFAKAARSPALLGTPCIIASGKLYLLEVLRIVKTQKLSCALGIVPASCALIHVQFAAKQFTGQWDLHVEEALFVNHVLGVTANSPT